MSNQSNDASDADDDDYRPGDCGCHDDGDYSDNSEDEDPNEEYVYGFISLISMFSEHTDTNECRCYTCMYSDGGDPNRYTDSKSELVDKIDDMYSEECMAEHRKQSDQEQLLINDRINAVVNKARENQVIDDDDPFVRFYRFTAA
jgi:hypothetical protein